MSPVIVTIRYRDDGIPLVTSPIYMEAGAICGFLFEPGDEMLPVGRKFTVTIEGAEDFVLSMVRVEAQALGEDPL